LVKAGSAIFTVIYSSVTAYTAMFSYFFFGRALHYMQWSGVSLVVIGLTSSSLGSTVGADDDGQVAVGICMIMVGSMFHSMVYIISESILARTKNPIAPEALGSLLGMLGATFYGTWQLVYTLPNYRTLVVDQIRLHNGSPHVIVVTYVALVVMNLVHSVCFFNLISALGSTTTGVMKGIQSVLVFVISHYAFCSFQASQCFSPAKGLSLIVVVCGVLMYSSFHLPPQEKEKDYIEISGTVVRKALKGGLYGSTAPSLGHEHEQHAHAYVFEAIEPGFEEYEQ
jgi:drug/metabolite transporter (DMT)-like permease